MAGKGRKNVVFFDLDGTLTDPAEGITNCVAYALREMGRVIPERKMLYRFIGPPLVYGFREWFGMSEEGGADGDGEIQGKIPRHGDF